MRRAGAALVAGLLLVSLPGCDSCGNVEIDTTMPTPRRVLRPADAVVAARVTGMSRISENNIGVELEVIEVLVDGPPDHPLAPGPLTILAYDHECAHPSGLLVAGDEPVLVALSRSASAEQWLPQAVLRARDDGSVEFLDRGGYDNQRIDEILPDPTVAGVIAEVEKP
ncbi:MAG: hypothetical protein KJ698_10065 [Actinobacteria bacterium]|nr:hypothetical protein [Actinomycetota bacterium]MBU1494785.1 hypothetical protein [Actinomycetota bacterium]MBU1865621.1 hypothetical protein [Actinomycetota bacterium]